MFTLDQRRLVYARFVREERAKLTPSVGDRLSGQQVAYAKGRARKRFAAYESATVREP